MINTTIEVSKELKEDRGGTQKGICQDVMVEGSSGFQHIYRLQLHNVLRLQLLNVPRCTRQFPYPLEDDIK